MFTQFGVEQDFTKTHKLLYGDPGTGKTTFAANMVDSHGRPPFFIFTEKGAGTNRPWGKLVDSWPSFLRLQQAILADEKYFRENFGCLVFDVIGDLEDMAEYYTSEHLKVSHISDLSHGKGWSLHAHEFKKGLFPLLSFPCVFIAHSKDRTLTQLGTNNQVTVLTANLGKRAFNLLNGKVDFTCYFQPPSNRNEHPIISLKPEGSRLAKSRYPHMVRDFVNKKGCPDKTWAEMCETFKKGI